MLSKPLHKKVILHFIVIMFFCLIGTLLSQKHCYSNSSCLVLFFADNNTNDYKDLKDNEKQKNNQEKEIEIKPQDKNKPEIDIRLPNRQVQPWEINIFQYPRLTILMHHMA